MKKALLSVLIFMFLISTTLVTAHAADSSIHKHNETLTAAELRIDGFCSDCYYETNGETYYYYSVCAQEGILSESWTHDILWVKDCQVTLLISHGAVMCQRCYKVREDLGYHDCWAVHTKCYLGQNNICPMDIS
jgi:hypothetical protein